MKKQKKLALSTFHSQSNEGSVHPVSKSIGIWHQRHSTGYNEHGERDDREQKIKQNIRRIGTKQVIKSITTVIRQPQQLTKKETVELNRKQNRSEVHVTLNKQNEGNSVNKFKKIAKKSCISAYKLFVQMEQPSEKDNSLSSFFFSSSSKYNEGKQKISQQYSNIFGRNCQNVENISSQLKQTIKNQLSQSFNYIPIELIKINPKINNKVNDKKLRSEGESDKQLIDKDKNRKIYCKGSVDGKKMKIDQNHRNNYREDFGDIDKIISEIDNDCSKKYPYHKAQQVALPQNVVKQYQQQGISIQNLKSSQQDFEVLQMKKIKKIKLFKSGRSSLYYQQNNNEKKLKNRQNNYLLSSSLQLDKQFERFFGKSSKKIVIPISYGELEKDINQCQKKNQNFIQIELQLQKQFVEEDQFGDNQREGRKFKIGQWGKNPLKDKLCSFNHTFHTIGRIKDRESRKKQVQQFNNPIGCDQFNMTNTSFNKNMKKFEMNKCIVQARKQILKGDFDF